MHKNFYNYKILAAFQNLFILVIYKVFGYLENPQMNLILEVSLVYHNVCSHLQIFC